MLMIMTKKFREIKAEIWILFVGVFISGIFSLYRLKDLTLPGILWDEFGYWSVGAQLSGKDWSGLASILCPYYSYGYGIILSIIIRLLPDMRLAYQAAIILNSLLISVTIFLLYKIFTYSLKNVDHSFIAFFCVIVSFYPNIISNAKIAWSEIPLLFTYTITTYMFVLCIVKKRILYDLMFVGALMYLYMIHQRSIGVLATGIFLIYWLRGKREKNFRRLILLTLVIVALLMIHSLFKDHMYKILWNNTEYNIFEGIIDYSDFSIEISNVLEVNEYSGQIGKVMKIFSLEGVKKLFLSFTGKIFYVGIATFVIGFEGFYLAAKLLYQEYRKNSTLSFFFLFIIISYLFTLCISSLYMIEPDRIDAIMYGRYTDWLLIPFIVLGGISFACYGINYGRISLYLLILCLSGIWIWSYVDANELNLFYEVCSPAIYIFKKNITDGNKWVLFMTAFMLALIISIWTVFNLLKKKAQIICFGLIAILWMRAGIEVINYKIDFSRKDMIEAVEDVLNDNESLPVYYVCNLIGNKDGSYGLSNYYMGAVQFLNSDRKIECVAYERFSEIEKGIILLPSYNFDVYFKDYKLEVIYDSDIYKIVKIL